METNTSNTAASSVEVPRMVRRPRGRIPTDVQSWLTANEPVYGGLWRLAICKCGRWYHTMDHLAPYHTEMNHCRKCGYKKDWNGWDA